MTAANVGLVVIIVGLALELAGVAMVWREYSDSRRKLGGAAGFVDSLTKLLAELARHPRSTVLFTFGTLLVFLGGLIAGVGGL